MSRLRGRSPAQIKHQHRQRCRLKSGTFCVFSGNGVVIFGPARREQIVSRNLSRLLCRAATNGMELCLSNFGRGDVAKKEAVRTLGCCRFATCTYLFMCGCTTMSPSTYLRAFPKFYKKLGVLCWLECTCVVLWVSSFARAWRQFPHWREEQMCAADHLLRREREREGNPPIVTPAG